MKVLVCGGRNFNDYNFLKQRLDKGLGKINLIIHGAARGADSLADKWAKENNISTITFPADWKKHGNKAGFIRNAEMLAKSDPDFVIAFNGGNGTKHMIDLCKITNVKYLSQADEAAKSKALEKLISQDSDLID